MIPGITLPLLARNLKVPTLRNLTYMLSTFALLHGLYHLVAMYASFQLAVPIDLISVVILILMGIYYSVKVS